jgi:hypothetical protein
MVAHQAPVGAHEAVTGQGISALGTCNNLRADAVTQVKSVCKSDTPRLRGSNRKARVMAKLHARPSNQYRYEHYDPRF